MELIEYEILLRFAPCDGYPPGGGMTFKREVSIVYQTTCYSNVKCYLILDSEREVECCDDPEIDTEIYEENGIKYRQITKKVPCGYKCCRRVYTVNCSWDNILNRWTGSVSPTFRKETYPGSDCNGTSTFTDCKTGDPIPCDGTCD